MTVTQIEIETMRQVLKEINERATRLENMLYNETAMQILSTTPSIRVERLCKMRDKVRHKANAMWEIGALLAKKINKLKNK